MFKKKEEESVENEEEGGGGGGVEVDNLASETWLLKNQKSPWAGKKEGLQVELTEEQKKYAEEYAKKKGEEKSGNSEKGEFVADKSTFHGKEERDYQGRSWIAAPKDAKSTNDNCYIPKRLVHTWSGHTKGVSAIRFFPKYGHLILSAGMDTKVKIWDVFNSGKCMRTYMGHSKAVRDIWFCNDGTKFLTAGYDKNIKYWDTETGQVISAFSTGKIPYVVRLNPDEDKQNILLAGMSDKKIVQWDMNTGQITQEYDQHLGVVNTITFVDNNRRFVTSSDDKSLRVWEFGIPVVIKYISEPHMHSMPAISLHPNTNWLAAQSLDNQILIYSTRERFQLNKKKRFAGHMVVGYACQVNFSPDGRFVMSGDGEVRLPLTFRTPPVSPPRPSYLRRVCSLEFRPNLMNTPDTGLADLLLGSHGASGVSERSFLPQSTIYNWSCGHFSKPLLTAVDDAEEILATRDKSEKPINKWHNPIASWDTKFETGAKTILVQPFSPVVIAADETERIRIWDYEKTTLLNSFDNHDYSGKGISKLCLVNELDDSLLLVASSDGNIRVWKDYTLKGKHKLVTAFSSIQGHRPGVQSVNAIVDWQQQSGNLVNALLFQDVIFINCVALEDPHTEDLSQEVRGFIFSRILVHF
ncbi:hypothetical protein ACSBR1_021741 [Camellia fascicularis]